MFKCIAFASVRPAACAIAFAMIAAIAVIATTPNSFAEEKKAAQQKKETPKGQRQDKQPQQPEAPQLIYSPWTKFCPACRRRTPSRCVSPARTAGSKRGQPVVAAVLIEPNGEPRKILRITLPLGMSLQQGTRVDHRPGAADDGALRDLLQQRLHGRL